MERPACSLVVVLMIKLSNVKVHEIIGRLIECMYRRMYLVGMRLFSGKESVPNCYEKNKQQRQLNSINYCGLFSCFFYS